MIATVARAIHHAHQRGIVHRDLKPSNVLVATADDRPMILDFGIAKCLGDYSLTLGTESPGTPAYRAPEQIDVQRKVRDDAIDVWALGVILYRCLTGAAPFKGEDALSLSVQIVSADPVRSRVRRPEIPPAVDALIVQCLAKNPRERPESADELAKLLENAIVPPTPGRPRRPRVPAAIARSTPTAVIVAAVVVGLAAWIVWSLSQGGLRPSSSLIESGGSADARRDPGETPADPWPPSDAAAIMDMVRVPEGRFVVGTDPSSTMTLPEFEIDLTEVTVAAYQRCIDAGRCTSEGLSTADDQQASNRTARCNWGVSGRDGHPINCVDWQQASTFCTWMAKRLPTDAEWEKAARGPDGRPYPWGHDAPGQARVANLAGTADGVVGTAPVGAFPRGRSPCGAADMTGNVAEWVQAPERSAFLVRGGGWKTPPAEALAFRRTQTDGRRRASDVGFRCAR